MRTTITLEADTDDAIRRLMRERRLSFKDAVNEAIRAGLAPRSAEPSHHTIALPMGAPNIPLDKALRIAAQLEDDELVRKLARRT